MDRIEVFQNDLGVGENALFFSPELPQPKDRDERGRSLTSYPKAVELLDNGDLIFRYAGEGVESVKVIIAREKEVVLEKKEEGLFEGVLPYDPEFPGPHAVSYIVNGTEVLNPYCPIWFGQNKPVNYVEFYDPEIADMISIKDEVPRGTVSQEIFYSDAAQAYARCFVYTPYGYEKGGEYPCLYLQHGATENETCWVYNGKLNHILDNLFYQGKAVPFIVVMNDGMIKGPHEKNVDGFDAITEIITKECREYIEGRYRIKTDKWNRAMAGLSRGSVQASVIGLDHPELYGYVGVFSGFMRRFNLPEHADNPHLDAVKDLEKFGSDYKVFFRSIGDMENESQIGRFTEDDEFMKQCGAYDLPNHIRKIYPFMRHEWGCWRRALIDFAQVIFR